MTVEDVASPFDTGLVAEVPLNDTPLVAVLCQVRFPRTLAGLPGLLTSGTLQSALQGLYPYAEVQQSFEFVPQAGSAPASRQGNDVWKFTDATEKWELTVAGDNVGFSTRAYKSRADFLEKLQASLKVIQEVVKPPGVGRVGVRYLNRVDETDRLEEWLRHLSASARGILTALDGSQAALVEHALSEVLYRWDDTTVGLQGRWGVLPAGAILDPVMPPSSHRSWVLDVDAFDDGGTMEFNSKDLGARIEELAARAYRFFRWVVTPAGIERFGVDKSRSL